ncbi:hypothetical protein [Tsuneonella sp. SYSU-LHT278]|uniref:hypothetical protein n=1 Tax=Tsuneonella sediminis TaxID=3416089 RepID=UPI003F7A3BCD
MPGSNQTGLGRYNRLFLWMIVPMVIMQAGIFYDYWGDFSDNAWPVHVHYWTATLWYLLLILQPYLVARGRFETHRTLGIIGIFVAGGVALTAIAALNRDIVNAERAAQNPEQFGFFEPWFFYGVAAVEIVMMTAFIIAIVQSIRHRHRVQEHAWWLVSTVFIIMMPALARGLGFVWIVVFGPDDPGVATYPIYLNTVIVVALLYWAAKLYGRFNHPATWLALAANLFNLLVEPLGKWEWMQVLLKTLIKP